MYLCKCFNNCIDTFDCSRTDITVLGYDHSLKNAIKFGIEESDIVTSVSESLAQQTQDIIETDKDIVPIYNFVALKLDTWMNTFSLSFIP